MWTGVPVDGSDLITVARAPDVRDKADVIVGNWMVIHITGLGRVVLQEYGVILINTSMTFKKSRDGAPDMRQRRNIGLPKAPVNEIAAPADGKRTLFCISLTG